MHLAQRSIFDPLFHCPPFPRQGQFDGAHAHIDQAKTHATGNTYHLAQAIQGQTEVWLKQGKLEEAMSGALSVVEIFEELGASEDVESCVYFIREIEEAISLPGTLNQVSAVSLWKSLKASISYAC